MSKICWFSPALSSPILQFFKELFWWKYFICTRGCHKCFGQLWLRKVSCAFWGLRFREYTQFQQTKKWDKIVMSSHWIKSIGAKFIYISRNLEKPVGFGLQTRYSICDNPWIFHINLHFYLKYIFSMDFMGK